MKHTIYIVEDNADIGYALEYFLIEEGFTVKIFPSLSAFHVAYKNELPDLFLLDVMLPDGDGLELCREIKNNNRSENIPVLMMSAHSPAEVLTKESCADGFILKPFDLMEISGKINSYL